MEGITRQVTQLQGDLHTSRSKLRMLKSTSKTDITNKIDAIRPPLLSAQRLIGHICSDNASFVARLEAGTANTGDPNSTPSPDDVLAEVPQKLVTLRTKLDKVVRGLVAAHDATATAIDTTDAWGLQVMDVGQDVDVKSTELARCQTGAALLAEKARDDLAECRAALWSAESELRRKRAEVYNKEREVEGKREVKRRLMEQIEEKNRQVRAAEWERKERKEQAAVSGITGGIALLLAPVTFGASLVVAAPALATAGYKVSRASDFRDEANSLRAQASTLDDSLSSSLREISSLESECSSLEWLIESRTAAIASHTAAQALHLRQITAAADAAEDISSLQAHAADTKRSVLEALPSLRGVRDALESVSVVVKEKALEVEVAAPASTLIERIADLRPGGGGPTARKRRRDAQRQLEALKCMTETLERVSAGLPALLEGGKIQLKQLDMSWEAQKQAEMKAIAARVPGAWKEG